MASAADFQAWAQPDLVIPLGGRDFTVRPPSVGNAAKLLACAVRAELNLGIVDGEMPAGVQAVLDTIGPDEHPALGDTFAEMVDAGLSPVTIDRLAYFAVFYWTRGEEYAARLARILWEPRDDEQPEGGEGPAPKAS